MKIQVFPKKGGVITGRFDALFYQLIRDMPGRKKFHDGNLIFELTAANIEYVQKHWPHAHWVNDDPLKRVNAIRDQEEATRRGKSAPLPKEAFNFEFKTKPYEHQAKGFFLSRDREYFALFMEMGTGKTKVLLDTAAYQYATGQIDTLLITAPNGVHRQWVEEQIPVHMPDWCPTETLVYTSNQSKKWLEQAEKVFATKDKLRVIAMHIDAFSTKKGKDFAQRVLTSGQVNWTLDESTRIKNHSAQRTKTVLALAPYAKRRRIASGAPVTQGVQDLYPQMKFLHEDILGYSSFYTFRNYYCKTRPIPGAPFGAVKIVGYQNLDKLTPILDGHSYRVTKRDCLDLPEKIYIQRDVPITEEQKRIYNELKANLISQLDNGTVIQTPMALVQLMKLQQVLCGFIYDEDGTIHNIPSNRVSVCMDALEETNGKVIIWARFHQDIENLSAAMKAAGIRFVEYSGRVERDQRAENKAAFINDPEVKVFLGNAQAGGTGTDGLQKVCHMTIYFSNDFNADTRWQSEDRTDRMGQSEASTYLDLQIANTVDTKIIGALRGKKNVADSILDVRDLFT